MRNVFRVFTRDVRRVGRVPAAWLVALFLIVLPSLYTWFNVAGFWDPYGNTGNLRICVVNEDAGVDPEMLGSAAVDSDRSDGAAAEAVLAGSADSADRLNVGDLVVAQLQDDDQLGWDITDRSTAMDALESGDAYAAFVIPSNFSEGFTTLLSGDPQPPSLEYYVNEKTGPVAPKITDTGASSLDTAINDAFVSQASQAIVLAFDQLVGQARADAALAQTNAAAKVGAAAESVADMRQSVTQAAGSVDAATAKAETAQQLLAGAGKVSGLLDQMKATLSAAASALRGTDDVLASLAADLSTVQTDIAALGQSEALDQLLGEDGQLNAQSIAQFMLSPTQVETVQLYPLNAYGSGMAPLFINLTLWIGAFMLMVIFRLEVDDQGIPNLSATQRFFGRWLLLAGMAALQAVVCCAGCIAMGVQTASAPAFFLTAVLVSQAYLAIQYMLSTLFQHVGKGLCVLLVFVQIPAATGLYPIEMTTGFFQAVYPIFPFTYGIGAMREVIAGFYGNAWLAQMGALAAFFVASLALGAWARPYLVNLNRLFAKQIQETDLLNGEEVQLPERRFRMAQLVRALADQREFRTALASRAGRFVRLYPQLKRGALALGIGVPLVVTAILSLAQAEKVVVLTVWLAWLVAVIVFLIVVEFMRDSLVRQASLGSMADQDIRKLYARDERSGDEQGGAR